MTNDQLKVIHIHRQMLGKLNPDIFDRGWFDLVLINVGRVSADADGKISSKGLSNPGFERVMAFLEDTIADAGGKCGTYWRDRDRRRGHYLTTRQEWQIGQLYDELRAAGVSYSLQSIVSQMSASRTTAVSELNPSEAFKVIEMLKATVDRFAARQKVSG